MNQNTNIIGESCDININSSHAYWLCKYFPNINSSHAYWLCKYFPFLNVKANWFTIQQEKIKLQISTIKTLANSS